MNLTHQGVDPGTSIKEFPDPLPSTVSPKSFLNPLQILRGKVHTFQNLVDFLEDLTKLREKAVCLLHSKVLPEDRHC